MMKITKEKIKKWRNGAEGFLEWVDEVKPMIPSSRGGFEVFKPVDFQIEAISKALEREENGNWKYQTIAFSFPRRHSKSTLNALLVLWRFTNFITENIIVLANSLVQTSSVGFSLCKKIILNTPFLIGQIGKENIQRYQIIYPKLQNIIQPVASSPSALYGQKITIAWVSEIHAAASDDAMQVLASSLGDTINSWLLCDSTVDSIGGPLHKLELLAKSGEDPTVFYYDRSYQNLEEALEKSPPWIQRSWLKSRHKQLLPATFASQHLNLRSESSSNLFAMDDIKKSMERFQDPLKINELKEMIHGRNYITGGGLDRAYFGSIHGDKTIWTAVAKVAGVDNEEADYYILNQKNIIGSLGTSIKKAIAKDVKDYELSNIIFESYNSQDVYTWAIEMKYQSEVIHATGTNQVPAFMELYRIVKEGRLHFSKDLKKLKQEMETFLYEIKGNKPKFGTEKFHDDRVYSLSWAIHALRSNELASYELGSINCISKSGHAPLCYLRSGDMILHCSNICEAHKKVEGMWLKHKAHRVETEITLPEFFHGYVKVTGVKIYKAI